MQWHQLDNMQTICTLLQADNQTNRSSLNFYRMDALPNSNQHCQNTEGTKMKKLQTEPGGQQRQHRQLQRAAANWRLAATTDSVVSKAASSLITHGPTNSDDS